MVIPHDLHNLIVFLLVVFWLTQVGMTEAKPTDSLMKDKVDAAEPLPEITGSPLLNPPTAPASAPAAPAQAAWRIPFYLFLNAASSVGIVATNKMVFKNFDFAYGTFLTFLHFVATFVGLEVCRWFGVFEYKPLKIMSVLPLCTSFCGFVVLTNLSLQYNSIGFYQIMKVMTTPLIIIIETLFFGETYGMRIKGSLGIICVGVIIATASDTDANFVGTVFALSALLITSMYQIWVKTKQKELECNSWQLLYYQAPLSALMLIPIVPIFDKTADMYERGLPDIEVLLTIGLTCCLAFLVNLSTFLVIGQTSPVTYNVLGHFKLTVILTLGFVFFGSPLDPKVITGAILTLTGVFWYTHLRQNGVK